MSFFLILEPRKIHYTFFKKWAVKMATSKKNNENGAIEHAVENMYIYSNIEV